MVLGNVAVMLGSGIAGAVLSDLPQLKDLLSGAAKVAKKHGKKDGGSVKSDSNNEYNAIVAQLATIRQEVEYLGSRPVTVISSAAKSGPGTYTITALVLAGVIGYAYIKWKGWKLSDLMFVTKRGLSDACHVVGSQLDQVSENVLGTRRHLSGRIDRVDITLDETQQIIEGTRDEVAVIHGDLTSFQEDLQSVNLVVQTLESKMGRLECSQDQTVDGIHNLCEFTRKMETAQTKNGNAVVGQVSSPPVVAAIGSCSEQRIVMRATCLPRPAPPRLSLEAAASTSHVVADQESSSPSSRAQESSSSSQASSVPPPSHHDGIMSSSSTDQDEAAGSNNTPHQPPHSSSNHQTVTGTRTTTTASRRFGGLSLQSGLGFLLRAATPATLLES